MTAELLKGAGGIFDVEADGQRVFCKHDEGRFPEDDEVIGLLRQREGSAA